MVQPAIADYQVDLSASLKEKIDVNDLKDVSAPTPADGDSLIWNDTSNKWESGGTSSTALEILTALKTVDGDGSGLDADLLGGVDNSLFARTDQASLIFDGGVNTAITIESDSGGISRLSLHGTGQGSGVLYVGQDIIYGGGIEYNGDNSPVTSGAGTDFTALYRRHSSVDYWTARNYFNSNDWEFRGNVTSGGTVDGRDLAVDGTKLDGLNSTSFLNTIGNSIGNYSTSGHITSGRGSGGVAMTVNDGLGNANVTFNHVSGLPEQDGSSARIVVNTDDLVNAQMDFAVGSGVTSGVLATLTTVLTLQSGLVNVLGDVILSGTVDGRDVAADGTTLDGILVSPDLTGIPTGPTASIGNNTTQLATTAFVQNAYVAPNFTTAGLPTTSSGAVVYDTTVNKLKFFNGTIWETVTSA